MEILLVDTGPLVAIANKRDKFHLGCSDFLKNYRGRLLTTWAVHGGFHRCHPAALSLD